MPDITMCQGLGCPIKEKCYRFMATPTPEWQSYFIETPGEFVEEEGKEMFNCDYFVK